MPLLLYWIPIVAKDKTPQNVGADDPPSTTLIDGVPVEGVEEFIYRGSKQSSNGATDDWMLYAGLDLPVQ